MEREKIQSSEIEDPIVRLSGSQPVLTKALLAGEIVIPMTNVAHAVLAQVLKVLNVGLLAEHSRGETFGRVEEKLARLLEEMSPYNM